MDYAKSYETLVIHPDKIDDLDRIITKIKVNKSAYEEVSARTTVPWYVIAAIHYRESTLSFKRHLHNGDPLTDRTVHVPKGHPVNGDPPFTWPESAIDALSMSWLSKAKDWSIGNMLALMERYNGLGYKNKGLPSPYVWSWTSVYKKGKYVEDGHFDPNVIDQQCGVAPILKSLM